ncbi:MAG: alpha-1,6-glucosidase domain-containing protein, partial [Pseudothermotoga sp.]
NSYNAPLSLNALDYERKAQFIDVFEYHKGLIELRKSHPAFRMRTSQEIREHIQFLETPKKTVGFTIRGYANNDPWEEIVVIYNGDIDYHQISLPEGEWSVVVDKNKAGTEILYTVQGTIKIPPISAVVMFRAPQ